MELLRSRRSSGKTGWLSSCGPGNSRKQPPHRVNSAAASGGLGPDAGTLHQGLCRCCPRPPLEVGLWPLLRHRIFRRPGNLAPASQPPSGRGYPLPLPMGRPETLVSVPLEADGRPRLSCVSGRGPCAVLPAQRHTGALHPRLHPWCQACSAQTRTCGLKWTLVPAPPLLTEDPEAGLPTLAPDRICVCPDPSHRHAGADISIHSALGETWGAGGDRMYQGPCDACTGRGPGLEQLRPTVQAGPGQQRTALGAPCAPHLQTSHRGVGLAETVGAGRETDACERAAWGFGPVASPGMCGPRGPPRASSFLWAIAGSVPYGTRSVSRGWRSGASTRVRCPVQKCLRQSHCQREGKECRWADG